MRRKIRRSGCHVPYTVKVQTDGDTHPSKVDLGVGVCRNEEGVYHQLKALREVFFLYYIPNRKGGCFFGKCRVSLPKSDVTSVPGSDDYLLLISTEHGQMTPSAILFS